MQSHFFLKSLRWLVRIYLLLILFSALFLLAETFPWFETDANYIKSIEWYLGLLVSPVISFIVHLNVPLHLAYVFMLLYFLLLDHIVWLVLSNKK